MQYMIHLLKTLGMIELTRWKGERYLTESHRYRHWSRKTLIFLQYIMLFYMLGRTIGSNLLLTNAIVINIVPLH